MAGFWAALPFIILFSSFGYCCVYATRYMCETAGNVANRRFLMYKEVWNTFKPLLELMPLYLRKRTMHRPEQSEAQCKAKCEAKCEAKGVLADP